MSLVVWKLHLREKTVRRPRERHRLSGQRRLPSWTDTRLAAPRPRPPRRHQEGKPLKHSCASLTPTPRDSPQRPSPRPVGPLGQATVWAKGGSGGCGFRDTRLLLSAKGQGFESGPPRGEATDTHRLLSRAGVSPGGRNELRWASHQQQAARCTGPSCGHKRSPKRKASWEDPAP